MYESAFPFGLLDPHDGQMVLRTVYASFILCGLQLHTCLYCLPFDVKLLRRPGWATAYAAASRCAFIVSKWLTLAGIILHSLFFIIELEHCGLARHLDGFVTVIAWHCSASLFILRLSAYRKVVDTWHATFFLSVATTLFMTSIAVCCAVVALGFHAVHIPATKYCIVIPTNNPHFLPMMNTSLVIGMLFHLNDALGTVFLLAKMRLVSAISMGGIRPATALSGVLLSQEMLCSVACAILCLGFSITISIPTLPLVYRSETMYVFIALTNIVACCYYRELDAFLVSAQKQPATRCSIGNNGLSRGNSGDGTSGTHRHHFDDSDLTGHEEPKIQYDEAALRRLAHWAKLNHRIKQDDVDLSAAGNDSPIVPTSARSDSKHQLGEAIQALPEHEENIEPADTHTEGDGPFASLKRRVSARKSKASNSSGAAAVQPDNLTTNSTVPPSPAPGLTDTVEELSLLPVLPPPAAPALRSHTTGEAVDHIDSRSSSYDDRLGTLLHPKGSLLPGYGRSRAHVLELAEITQDVSNPATPASAVLPKDRTRNGFTALTPPPWQQKRKRPTPQHQHQHQHPAKRINRRSRGHRTSFCEDQSTEEVEDEDVRLAHAKLCSALMGLPLPEEEGLVR